MNGTWSGDPDDHPWLEARGEAALGPGSDPMDTAVRATALRTSAWQSYTVRNTPTILHVDVLGRPFLEQRAKTSAQTVPDSAP